VESLRGCAKLSRPKKENRTNDRCRRRPQGHLGYRTMTDVARELHRIISASVRDVLIAYRIQAQVGRVRKQPAATLLTA
jgi:hypothetical protein